MITSIETSPISAIQQYDLPLCDKMGKIKNITQSILELKRRKTEQHLKCRERWWQRLHPTKHNDFILLTGDIFSGFFIGVRTLRYIGIVGAALPYILLVFGIIGGIIKIRVGISCIRQGTIAFAQHQGGLRLWMNGILLILIGIIMIGGPILIQFGEPILVKLGLTIAATELIIDIGLSISFALLSIVVTIEIIRKFIWLCRKTDVKTKCLKQVAIMKEGKVRTRDERQDVLKALYGKKLYDKRGAEFQQLMLDQMSQEEAQIGPDISFALSQMKIDMTAWMICEQELEEYRIWQTSSLVQQYQNTIACLPQDLMTHLPHGLIDGNNLSEAVQKILELKYSRAEWQSHITSIKSRMGEIQETYNESQMYIGQLEERSSQCQRQLSKDAATLEPLIKAYRTKLGWRLLQQIIYIIFRILWEKISSSCNSIIFTP